MRQSVHGERLATPTVLARPMLEEILSAVERRGMDYAGALWSYAVVVDASRRSLYRAELRFAAERTEPRGAREYEGLVFGEEWLSMADARKLLELISARHGSLPFLVDERAHWQHVGRPQVGFSSFDRYVGLPQRTVLFAFASGSAGVPLQGTPAVHFEHPVFLDRRAAVDDWLSESRSNYIPSGTGVLVILPDPRGAVTRVRVTDDRLEVEVTPGTLSASDLAVRASLAYVKSSHKIERVTPHIETQGESFVGKLTKGIPQHLELFLMDRRDGSVVDWHSFYEVLTSSHGLLEVELPSKKLIELITMGENEEFELKEQVNDKALISITSLANTAGGILVIGVDDERNPVGVNDPAKEAGRLLDMINSLCEPVPHFQLSHTKFHDVNLIVVRVSDSPDPPYTLRGKGVYVRRKDRNVLASRHDLDEMYRQRGSGTPAAWPF